MNLEGRFYDFGWSLRAAKNRLFEKIREVRRFAKKVPQRALRGIAQEDSWSLDTFACTVIAQGCRDLIKMNHGYPPDLTNEQWIVYLESVAIPLEKYVKLANETVYDELSDRQKQIIVNNAKAALRRFTNRLEDMWD